MLLNLIRRNWLAVIFLTAPVFDTGCYYDKEELLYPTPISPNSCAPVPATFNANVLPLITSRCAKSGCHDATASGGRTFQNYNQISAAKDRINMRAVLQKSMPPTGPLPAADVKILKCWIEGGALNN